LGPVTNVKAKLLFFVSLLGILLIISTPVVSSVFVNLISPTETVPLSSSPAEVLMGPWPAGKIGPAIIDHTLQPYNTTIFHVNVTGVSDLFTWQVNMTWDPSILNVSSIIPGEFLALSENQTSSEVLGLVIDFTNNAEGYTGMAESILGEVSGITGEGRLVSIEFLVVGYGSTDLNITASGTLPTMLLNSTGDSMAFTTILVTQYFTAGYFRNKGPGDVDGDYYVGAGDASVLYLKYGVSIGNPIYDREADFDYDGYIGAGDASVLYLKYGKTYPPWP